MLTRDRIMTVITVGLLNLFTVGAGLAVANLTPERHLSATGPSVALRTVVPPDENLAAAASDTGPMPNGSTLGARLNSLLGSPGANVNAVVIDATTLTTLYNRQADVPAVPASTTKVVTSTAALSALGPDYRLTTKVVRQTPSSSPGTGGQADGQGGGAGGEEGIVLVGGGDPTLSTLPPVSSTAATSTTSLAAAGGYPRPASLLDLAKRTATALKAAGTRRVRVSYDASAYQGARTAASWKPNYVGDGEAAPVTALMVNEGRIRAGAKERVADPPIAAVKVFLRALRSYGISAVYGSRTTAPALAQEIAEVQSPPVSALVESMLTSSDNDLAEALARQVAIKRGVTPDFDGGASAVRDTLAGLGDDASQGISTHDGSGLSPQNQVTPMALARLIAMAGSDAHPELRAVLTGLPVAGFSGTLRLRYTTPLSIGGAGVVRAKTGTLAGVSTLAGMAYDTDGRLLAFAFMANDVKAGFDAPDLLDALASAVSGCGCGQG